MHLPKYSNPHLTVDTTRIVSRRTLQLEDDADDDAERGGNVDWVEFYRHEMEDLRAKLDKIVSKRSPTSSDDSHFNMRRRFQAEEGERTSAEPRQDSEPVGEFTSSCSPPEKPPEVLFKSSVWYRNHYPLVPFISSKNLQRPYRKFSFVLSCIVFQNSSLMRLFSVSKNRLAKTQNRDSKSASIVSESAVDLDQIKHTFPMVRMSWVESLILTHIFGSSGE